MMSKSNITTQTELEAIIKKFYAGNKHVFIQSAPGLGKTHLAKKYAIKHVPVIQGETNLPALVRIIATAEHLSPNNHYIIDDCDGVLIKNLNVFKGILDKERRVLSYEKDLSARIQTYINSEDIMTAQMGLAMRKFSSGIGVNIPLGKSYFMFLSNMKLPDYSPMERNVTKINLAAIKSRVNYYEIDLSQKELQVWLLTVAKSFKLDKEQKAKVEKLKNLEFFAKQNILDIRGLESYLEV